MPARPRTASLPTVGPPVERRAYGPVWPARRRSARLAGTAARESAEGSADPGLGWSGSAEPEPGFFDEAAIGEQDAAQEAAAVPF